MCVLEIGYAVKDCDPCDRAILSLQSFCDPRSDYLCLSPRLSLSVCLSNSISLATCVVYCASLYVIHNILKEQFSLSFVTRIHDTVYRTGTHQKYRLKNMVQNL